MFTGLIEEQGRIKNIFSNTNGMEITIECEKILSDIKQGASISVNGACQSVTDFGKNYIKLKASNETLNVTNFKSLKIGDYVNLERALILSSRIDGHIVSGHIDCTAEFLKAETDGFSKRLYFKIPEEYNKYLIYKGSIAINGVSLTIAKKEGTIFCCEIIPDTLTKTNLNSLVKGNNVNIETDLFAKYIENFLNSKDNKSKIDYNFLEENGFV